jgi:ATP-dependent DNA ligase
MAQRCARVNTVEEMFKGMKGQPFTVEMKFDGNRLQVCAWKGEGDVTVVVTVQWFKPER